MQPPSRAAASNSSRSVLLEVNMRSSPAAPMRRPSTSSGAELQSKPKPISRMIASIRGLGRAFTAKYSRKPGTAAKAAFRRSPVARIPASS